MQSETTVITAVKQDVRLRDFLLDITEAMHADFS